jgi:RimJ/RimL family protein N-acetyltransferase
MTEGMALALDVAFAAARYRVEVNIQPSNAALAAPRARIGFTREGFRAVT